MKWILHLLVYIASVLLLTALSVWFISELVKSLPELIITAVVIGLFFILPICLIEEYRRRKE